MRFGQAIQHLLTTALLLPHLSLALPATSSPQIPIISSSTTTSPNSTHISPSLFASLEELARLVDISYCVGGISVPNTGIQPPFTCLSRCSDFPAFELITSWNTGPLLSDSCGYVAYDHNPANPRIVVAFRGTYSIANTIADLSTVRQEYVPYLGEGEGDDEAESPEDAKEHVTPTCTNCTVHTGFLRSWHNTRPVLLPHLTLALQTHPTYSLVLVGHSLGGAVALLAGLEFRARGWNPQITTFGEPRVGNGEFVKHVDDLFVRGEGEESMYRRVTHVDDPVPLLPPTEWGYRPHAGEVFIAKAGLPPAITDVFECVGDEDKMCSAGADVSLVDEAVGAAAVVVDEEEGEGERGPGRNGLEKRGIIPARYKLWQLFFSHRDYFWRLGVCLKGGDPWDWKGTYPAYEVGMDEL